MAQYFFHRSVEQPHPNCRHDDSSNSGDSCLIVVILEMVNYGL